MITASCCKVSLAWVLLLCSCILVFVQAQSPTTSPTTTNMSSSIPTMFSPPPTPNTTIPTTPETMAPTRNTTAPSISMIPTMAPTPNRTTARPTAGISSSPTAEPSASPTKSPQPTPEVLVPTIAPTNAPTTSPSGAPTRVTLPPVVTEPVKASIKGIKVTFYGVESLDAEEFILTQNEMETWFTSYFNEEQRRLLQSRRGLQFRVPAVQDMSTAFDISGQNSNTAQENAITYTQTLSYMATADAKEPEDYVQLPFLDTPYKQMLVEQLRNNVDAFSGLTDISNPVIPVEPESDESGLSLGAIIGIAVGGAAGLLLLAWGAYAMGSRRDDRHPVSDGIGAGYSGSGDLDDPNMMPSTFQLSHGDDDIISTMDDPTVAKLGGTMSGEASALGGYGDQSVATVDYDYSKAYGGAGDTSVVSSVGGTLGDATRQTAGDVAAAGAAGRIALGASYDDNRMPREQVIVVEAPAGKLGVVIDTPDDGAPVVHAVKDTSVIADKIRVGDKLIKVDDEDVRSMTAIKVSKLISKKSANPVRRLTIVRMSPANP